jgi:D-glycero-D-manno-heptose 1,7-bisphosphate phosphatase
MAGKKALFLDRDGVVNVDRPYVHSKEAFEFQCGIFELCRAAQDLGYALVVVTNQAGIARGYYTETDFLELTEWMSRQFADRGIRLAGVYYCPYHPIHGLGEYKRDSVDRKPNPGLVFRAEADLKLDLRSSVLIGDKFSDIEAGKAAGVGTTVLLRPGVTEAETQGSEYCVCGSLDEIRSRFFSGATGERRGG